MQRPAGALLALALAALSGLGGRAARSSPKPPPCTCHEQQYCKPLTTPPSEFEIYPFVLPSSCSNPGTSCGNMTADWFDTFRWVIPSPLWQPPQQAEPPHPTPHTHTT